MKTSIRIEVDDAIYHVLITEQEKRRRISGRKTALSNLILEFCAKGLTVFQCNEQNSAHLEQKNVQDSGKMNIPEAQNTPENSAISIQKQYDLFQLEQRLAAKERNIAEREQQLISKVKDVTERLNGISQERDELISQKELLLEKANNKMRLQWLVEQQSTELKTKSDTIQKLQQENIQYKEKVFQVLSRIDQKTEKNIFLDYIVPFLPSLGVIISYFLLNKKIGSIQELNPVQQEIKKLFEKLPEDAKKKFNTLLSEDVKKVTGTN